MSKEIDDKETMDTAKTKKTTKKKVEPKKETISLEDVSAQIFKDLNGKFLLVKVGSDIRPADSIDIEHIEQKLISLFEENNVNCLAFVTHHAVEMEIIEKLK